VGRSYAGILGPLAFMVVVGRGWLAGTGVESTLWTAWLGLIAFAGIGYVLGQLADWIIYDSVRSALTAELRQQATKTEKSAKAAMN